MEWIDDNHIKGEMTDDQFLGEVVKIAKTRDIARHGRDGFIKVYEERFEYKGVPYIIKVLRYFQIGVPINEIKGINKIGKHAVLEYPPELNDLARFLEDISSITGFSEFLWRDTLHYNQQNWTLKQMVEQMHMEARECIDYLPKIKQKIQAQFRAIMEKLDKLLPSNPNPLLFLG
jgi:hypothetical protein